MRKSNKTAQVFYKNIGFVDIGIIPNYYGDEDAHVMARSR